MFVVNCNGRSKELFIFWKDLLDVTILSYNIGHIDCTVNHLGKKWRFTGFYGNPYSSKRHLSWDLLRRLKGLHEVNELPWLVGGDFNEICYDREKLGGIMRSLNQTQEFRDVLDDCYIQDLHASGEFFTWINRRSAENITFERLDRYVATFDWILLYPAARAHTL